MGPNNLPTRIFLDTCTLNFILDYGECIFEGTEPPPGTNDRVVRDIHAFYNIFLTGRRAFWQLAISPFTYVEILQTRKLKKRLYLQKWFMEVWDYWLTIRQTAKDFPSFVEAENMKIEVLSSLAPHALNDIEDRVLICDALSYRCDCFCTRDWKTILKYREELRSLPIRILTPTEWWELIRPWAPLWA